MVLQANINVLKYTSYLPPHIISISIWEHKVYWENAKVLKALKK